MATRSAKNGFTLAELLVASMLLSIVMTAVYTLLFTTLGAWRVVNSSFNTHAQARNVMTMIARELENVAARADFLFEGGRDSLTMFVVSEPMNVEDSEGRHLMRVRYRFNRSKGVLEREEALVETALPNRPAFGEEVKRDRIKTDDRKKFILARGVEAFKIRYLWIPKQIRKNAEQPPQPVDKIFVTRHKDNTGFPQAIEVTLKVRNPQDRRDEGVEFQAILPIHAPNFRYTEKQLEERLRGLT